MTVDQPIASGSCGSVVPLAAHHLDELYVLEAGPDRFVDWRFKGLSPVPNEFASASMGCWSACAVLDRDGALAGAITLDRYRPEEATAELAVVAAPGSARVLVMAGAVGIVAAALDRRLTAVYLHTTEYQEPVRTMLLRRFRLEVHRIQSEWHRGRYWDSYVFRIDRADRRDRLARVAERAASMAAIDPACLHGLDGPTLHPAP